MIEDYLELNPTPPDGKGVDPRDRRVARGTRGVVEQFVRTRRSSRARRAHRTRAEEEEDQEEEDQDEGDQDEDEEEGEDLNEGNGIRGSVIHDRREEEEEGEGDQDEAVQEVARRRSVSSPHHEFAPNDENDFNRQCVYPYSQNPALTNRIQTGQVHLTICMMMTRHQRARRLALLTPSKPWWPRSLPRNQPRQLDHGYSVSSRLPAQLKLDLLKS